MGTIIIQGENGKVEFGTMAVPNRKNKALIRVRGRMVEVLAYFRNDDCEKEFDKIMDFILESYNASVKKR